MIFRATNSIFIRLAGIVLAGVLLASCLGDDDSSEVVVSDAANATVKTFTFKDNSKVSYQLSSYAFSIDNLGVSDPDLADEFPGAGIIFNPDSLPVGTVPDSITVSMTYSSPSQVIFYGYDYDGTLADSVDFLKQQVVHFGRYARTRLHVVARNGFTSKDYIVKVNVHQTVGDTIEWKILGYGPWDGTRLAAQHAVQLGGSLYWLAQPEDGATEVSTTALATPLGEWSIPQAVRLAAPDTLDLASLFTLRDTLFAASRTTGRLCWSADAVTWTADPSRPYLAAVEPSLGSDVPAGFPVRGFTTPVVIPSHPDAGMSTSRIILVGGETASGALTSSTWAFDGTQWVEMPQVQLPVMTGAGIAQYTTDTDQPGNLWLLWPGLTESGPRRTLYMSANRGVTWRPLASDHPRYADWGDVPATASPSVFHDEASHWIYVLGGETADGQTSAIVGGQLRKLTYDKQR